jgi:Ca2+-binding EF-hand superfamily protein
MSAAERVRRVRAEMDGEAGRGGADSGVAPTAGALSPIAVVATAGSVRGLPTEARVRGVLSQIEAGHLTVEELGQLHGTTVLGAISLESAEVVRTASAARLLPPSNQTGAGAAVSAKAGSTAMGRTHVHARRMQAAHERKLAAIKLVRGQMQRLREQPLLSSQLRKIAEGLARMMRDNPRAAEFLERRSVDAELRQAFLSMDIDASGSVSYAEFSSGLRRANVDVGTTLAPLFEVIDADGSGSLDLLEFQSAISAARTLAASSGSPRARSPQPATTPAGISQFHEHDADADRRLSREELKTFLSAHGITSSPQLLDELLERYGGPDGSGVSLDQYAYMRHHVLEAGVGGVRTVRLRAGVAGFGLSLEADSAGAVVAGSVHPASSAALAGVLRGDRVVAIGGVRIRDGAGCLEQAQHTLQRVLDDVAETDADTDAARGRYKAVRTVEIRSRPSAEQGMICGQLQQGEEIDVLGAEEEQAGQRWLHFALGWVAQVSLLGQQQLTRSIVSSSGLADSKPARSDRATIEWQFGPRSDAAAASDAADVSPMASRLEELKKMEAEILAHLQSDWPATESEREQLQETLRDVRRQRSAELADDATAVVEDTPDVQGLSVEDSPEIAALQEEFNSFDVDGQGALSNDDLRDLLLSRGYDDITDDYVADVMDMYSAGQDFLTFEGFLALRDFLDQHDDEEEA